MERKNDQATGIFRIRGLAVFGALILVTVFGGIGVWSATAPLASGVVAAGSIVVDSERKTVQHLDGGIVKEILVNDGYHVEAGSVVVRLDKTRPTAEFAVVRGALDEALAAEARLTAELYDQPAVDFPETLQERALEIATILEGHEILFSERKRSVDGEIGILNQRISQLDDLLVGLDAQKGSLAGQVSLVNKELSGLEKLLKKGHTTQQRVLALRREATRLKGAIGEAAARMARAETSKGETKLQIVQVEQQRRESISEELRDVRARVLDLTERLTTAQQRLKGTDIRAPVDGVVVGLGIHTKGAVLPPGSTVLEIVPSEAKLVVEVRMSPQDIDNVVVGQTADVRLTAFKMRSTPVLNGVLSYVSADALMDQVTGVPYFEGRIDLMADEVKKLDGKALTPGMPAEVIIMGGERTVLAYLAQPISDSMARAWREE